MRAVIHTTADGREFVRTPDEAFNNLPDFPYQPNYVEIDGLRMHYVDEGPREGQSGPFTPRSTGLVVSYRKMIPLLIEAGHRVIAPDMIGMGRSTSPLTSIHTPSMPTPNGGRA